MIRILLVCLAAALLAAPGVAAQETAAPAGESVGQTAPPLSVARAGAASIEVRAFRALNGGLVNPVFDAVMPWLTDFERTRIFVILAWAALVIFGKTRGRWAALVLIPIIVASDQIASSVIKPLVDRARPCEVLGHVHLWWGAQGWIWTPDIVTQSYKGSPAFPSSHAANITASMLFLGLVYRRLLAPLLALAFLVGFSRIYIGVHWPSDILGGMALGAAIACLAYLAFRRLYRGAEKAEAARAEGTPREPDTSPPE